ncbi:hypothetical protein QYF61_027698 [Mycteria americana]|uniref:Uncharacterized protein n=1 Tax=Mycteria americana TaxID=33587 RepID=A0AAN7MJ28_MYCAM|nr:hypothetical protein QYF61_027698 [Mycteria americana]
MENPSTVGWLRGCNIFSLSLTSSFEEEPNIQPFITDIGHRRPAVQSCQTHCIFEILVPHAVDERVQCCRHHRVQNCHQQIQRWELLHGGGGLQVGNHGSADKQGDHGQVRKAHGKGFVASLLRGDPQHSPEDLHIGQHDENKTP